MHKFAVLFHIYEQQAKDVTFMESLKEQADKKAGDRKLTELAIFDDWQDIKENKVAVRFTYEPN